MSVPAKILKAPESNEKHLTTKEKIIILQASKLHGTIFKPWAVPPVQAASSAIFQDDFVFHLSEEQQLPLKGWETVPPEAIREFATSPTDLVQDLTSDCSVVASLCAISARADYLRGIGLQNVASLIPLSQDVKTGALHLRFFFNGAFRRVVVDTQLPMSKTSRQLHVFDRLENTNLFPALIEKAYLKVRAGYDFPGSNSSTDLLMLTGWIPEQVFLENASLDRDSLWKRMASAWANGDVLITVGTKMTTSGFHDEINLVSGHDYSVLDLRDGDSGHEVLLKNPWFNSTAVDASSLSPSVSLGKFWMSFDTLVEQFGSIYLNFNPGLFQFRRDVHFAAERSEDVHEQYIESDPQYSFSAARDGTVWFLLDRHVEEVSRDSHGQRVVKAAEYLSLHLFKGRQRRLLSENVVQRAPFVNNPHSLLQADVKAGVNYNVALLREQPNCGTRYFSLSAFSNVPLSSLIPAQTDMVYTNSIKSEWTSQNSGGNMSSSRFMQNPRFILKIEKKCNVSFLICPKDVGLNVHIVLVWGSDQRSTNPTTRDILFDSGQYRRGFACITPREIEPGAYTVVCSTFTQGNVSAFDLTTSSNLPGHTLSLMPPFGHGMFMTGPVMVVFAPGQSTSIASFVVTRMTEAKLRLSRTVQTHDGGSLSISVYRGSWPHGSKLYEVSREGSLRDDLESKPIHLTATTGTGASDQTWLLIERSSSLEQHEIYNLELFSSNCRVECGDWHAVSRE